MEVLSKAPEFIDVFLGGDEYHALLRPAGMLDQMARAHPEIAATVKSARHFHGAVLHIPASVAPTLIGAPGTHLMDDLLRRTIARWYAALDHTPPGGYAT